MLIPGEVVHGLDLRLFVSTFALIFVAELPDKTAFATVLLEKLSLVDANGEVLKRT